MGQKTKLLKHPIIFLLGFAFCFIYLVSGVINTNNLLVYYSFDSDNRNATTVFDLSGKNKHGIIIGGSFVDGIIGDAYYVDQSQEKIVNNNFTISNQSLRTDGLTFNFWFKKTDDPSSGSKDFVWINNSNLGILSKELDNFDFNLDNDGEINFRVENGLFSVLATSNALVNNEWYMVTGIYSLNATGSNGMNATIYINSVFNDDDILGGTNINHSSDNITLAIGYLDSIASNVNFSIDEFRIYNRTLNQSEINELYSQAFFGNLNVTFVDEITNQVINTTTIDFVYSSTTDSGDNFTTNGLLSFIDLDFNDYIFIYDGGNAYPQRTYNYEFTETSNLTLYLLNSSDGIYVTFQVVNSVGSPLFDALVTATTSIGGTNTLVGSGNTDSAGSVTLWLDPLSSHTIEVSKSGYETNSVTITPTQSSYTIILESSSSDVQVSPVLGINYNVNPDNIILNNNTIYNFTFNISSSYWNLTSYGFKLINTSNGQILNITSGSTASGSVLSVMLNTGNHTSITMNYFWVANGNYSNQSQTWTVRSTYQGDLSILTFFEDLGRFVGAGFDDFGRILISIILVVVVTGFISYQSGIYSPALIGGVIVFMVGLLEKVDFLPPIERKYVLTIFISLVWVGVLIQEASK